MAATLQPSQFTPSTQSMDPGSTGTIPQKKRSLSLSAADLKASSIPRSSFASNSSSSQISSLTLHRKDPSFSSPPPSPRSVIATSSIKPAPEKSHSPDSDSAELLLFDTWEDCAVDFPQTSDKKKPLGLPDDSAPPAPEDPQSHDHGTAPAIPKIPVEAAASSSTQDISKKTEQLQQNILKNLVFLEDFPSWDTFDGNWLIAKSPEGYYVHSRDGKKIPISKEKILELYLALLEFKEKKQGPEVEFLLDAGGSFSLASFVIPEDMYANALESQEGESRSFLYKAGATLFTVLCISAAARVCLSTSTSSKEHAICPWLPESLIPIDNSSLRLVCPAPALVTQSPQTSQSPVPMEVDTDETDTFYSDIVERVKSVSLLQKILHTVKAKLGRP